MGKRLSLPAHGFETSVLGPARQDKRYAICRVVFGRPLFIFSDKPASFPQLRRRRPGLVSLVQESRQKSADQVWGAERCLHDYPIVCSSTKRAALAFRLLFHRQPIGLFIVSS